MTRKLWLCLFLGILLPVLANAQRPKATPAKSPAKPKSEWVFAAYSSKDGGTDIYAFNSRTLVVTKRSPLVVRVWVRERSFASSDTKLEKPAESLLLWDVRCTLRQYRMVEIADRDENGDAKSVGSDENATWNNIYPDSVGEGVYDKVCSLASGRGNAR